MSNDDYFDAKTWERYGMKSIVVRCGIEDDRANKERIDLRNESTGEGYLRLQARSNNGASEHEGGPRHSNFLRT